MKVVTSAQMAALEEASERRGVSTDALMENAGLAVAETVRTLLGGVADAEVTVLVGPGNNGADGLVTARHLRRWGARVSAYLVAARPPADPKMDLARDYDVEIISSVDDPGMDTLLRLLRRSRVVVDAVLGTGRSRPLSGGIKEAMLRLQASRSGGNRPQVVALDLPTGVNADTGEVDSACPQADVTVALGRPKVGLLTFPGAAMVGKLEVADIGLPADLKEEQDIALELLAAAWVGQRLPTRPVDAHKGSFGHALVVAGSRNYVGAACLASLAAARVGAGLVTLASPVGVYQVAAGSLTEIIHLPLPEDDQGRIHPDGAGAILRSLHQYDALLVGCGLGRSQGTVEFMERLLLNDSRSTLPTVIDADGLNNMSSLPQWWSRLRGRAAVTPHPGEMATLAGIPVSQVQQDRVETACRWATHWNVDLTLKGAHTVITQPDGMACLSPFANPALASGGTGDVLSGIIVGLMAQGLSPGDACCCGVYLHGLSGEIVREKLGESGPVASDLIAELPAVIGQLRKGVSSTK